MRVRTLCRGYSGLAVGAGPARAYITRDLYPEPREPTTTARSAGDPLTGVPAHRGGTREYDELSAIRINRNPCLFGVFVFIRFPASIRHFFRTSRHSLSDVQGHRGSRKILDEGTMSYRRYGLTRSPAFDISSIYFRYILDVFLIYLQYIFDIYDIFFIRFSASIPYFLELRSIHCRARKVTENPKNVERMLRQSEDFSFV